VKVALWVTQVYPRDAADPLGRFLHLLARELPARGWSVRVIAPAADEVPEAETRDGVRIVRFRYASRGRQTLAYTGRMHREALRHPARLVSFLRSCRRAVAAAVTDETPAVVHAHWWAPSGVAAAPVAARARTPLALSLHGTDVRLLARLRPLRPLARRVFARAGAVLPVSRALAAEIGRMGLGGGRSEVLPMPADEASFFPDPELADPGRPEFVVAARLTPQKQIGVVIRALALGVPGAPILHVAGDGPERAALESFARSSGLGDRVRFHGTVGAADLAALFRRARAVVLPSVGEGYGLTLREGALCGAAGIGARSGGIPEIVEDAVTGLLFEPGDAPGLAAALAELAADADRARRLGAAARERALQFTSAPLADRLVAVYARLTAS